MKPVKLMKLMNTWGFKSLRYRTAIRLMGLDQFTRDDPVFADESVLRDTHRPKELIERDSELQDYQEALRPVVNAAPRKTSSSMARLVSARRSPRGWS